MADEIEQSGASEQPVAPASPSTGQAPPIPAPQSTPPEKVDLTTIPQFRAYQSQMDREKQQREAELASMRAEVQRIKDEQAMAAAERQRQELAQIETLDPAEQAKLYKQKLAEAERERARQSAEKQITDQAMSILADAGIPANDPRLVSVWQLGATPQAVTMLARTVALIQRQEIAAAKAELEEARKPKPAQAQAATQQAVIQALDNAGVTRVSGAPTVVNSANPNEEMRKKLLAEYQSFAGKGVDNPRYRDFATRLMAMGKNTGDLYESWG